MDTRRTPSNPQIAYFKQRATSWERNTTDLGKASAAKDLDYYLLTYTGLEEFDPRTKGMTADPNKDYIEVKMGGITLRKQNGKLTITNATTIDYSEANVLVFKRQLEAGLDVIATADKHEVKTTSAGASL